MKNWPAFVILSFSGGSRMRLLANFVTRIKTALLPELEIQIGPLSDKERKFAQIIEMMQVDRFTRKFRWCRIGRKPAAEPRWLTRLSPRLSGICRAPKTSSINSTPTPRSVGFAPGLSHGKSPARVHFREHLHSSPRWNCRDRLAAKLSSARWTRGRSICRGRFFIENTAGVAKINMCRGNKPATHRRRQIFTLAETVLQLAR